MLGGTGRYQISEKRRVIAWTSGRCDASACGRVSRVSESSESSDGVDEWLLGRVVAVMLLRVVERVEQLTD